MCIAFQTVLCNVHELLNQESWYMAGVGTISVQSNWCFPYRGSTLDKKEPHVFPFPGTFVWEKRETSASSLQEILLQLYKCLRPTSSHNLQKKPFIYVEAIAMEHVLTRQGPAWLEKQVGWWNWQALIREILHRPRIGSLILKFDGRWFGCIWVVRQRYQYVQRSSSRLLTSMSICNRYQNW